MAGAANNRLRIATIADAKFKQRAGNLLRSLENSPNEFHLTIYCHDEDVFRDLAGARCDIVELAEIRRLGAKRAKLTAFAHALRGGSVLYLDADAIVLESLDGLWGGPSIKGVAVGLDNHTFILDKHRPWPGSPLLVRQRYIMSGGFYAPAELYPLFERIRLASLDDAVWRQYIVEGFLYDQHFLNAFLNLHEAPIQLVDPTVYGWEGLSKEGFVQVYRSGSKLINRHNQQLLRLILFGGLQQTPEMLRSLPLDIAALVCERISRESPAIDDALIQLYAGLSRSLGQPPANPDVQEILTLFVSEVAHLAKACAGERDVAGESSYFAKPEAVRSIVFANASPECLWNGLRCGGACLDAEEYRQVRAIVRAFSIRGVLETGAGETSILFRNLGLETYSLEYQSGPWLDRAAERGCACLFVPFDTVARRFAEPELQDQLAAHGVCAVDLLFIDSPIGTANRRNVLAQLLKWVKPRFVLFHDARRDASNIFEALERHDLKLVRFIDSPRGLCLLAPESEANRGIPGEEPAPSTVVPEPTVSIALLKAGEILLEPGGGTRLRVAVTNTAGATLSSRYTRPVHLAYHWRTQNGELVVWDGERTTLPCDLEPGDSVECLLNVLAPEREGEYRLEPAMVQEDVAWFESANPSGSRVYVGAGKAALLDSK